MVRIFPNYYQKFPPDRAKLPLRSKSGISLEKSKYVPVQKIFSKIFSSLGKFGVYVLYEYCYIVVLMYDIVEKLG